LSLVLFSHDKNPYQEQRYPCGVLKCGLCHKTKAIFIMILRCSCFLKDAQWNFPECMWCDIVTDWL
jgi:hypothetical protein